MDKFGEYCHEIVRNMKQAEGVSLGGFCCEHSFTSSPWLAFSEMVLDAVHEMKPGREVAR